ncbi:MAG: hypothetical protein ACYTXA_24680 [Nostoc sp.]
MLFTNQLSEDGEEYEIIDLRIGEIVGFINSLGMINWGKVKSADPLENTVIVLCGNVIEYEETVHADNLLER